MSTQAPPRPAVRIAGVSKTFRSGGHTLRAVDDIDLDVPRGEIMALLGPNGAGKTTALDMVLGLTEPTAGQVSVDGQPPRQAVTNGRVSAVLQSGGLLRDLSVAETVRMIASTFKYPMGVEDVMAKAGITGLAKRKVSKCSGGEQQRLRFALALLPDPDLLILDEPTAGMDVAARREFWDTMRADADSGRTIIFATHYLEEADSFAERIVLMAGGHIVADGSTEEIRTRATGRTVSANVPAGTDALACLEGMEQVHHVDHNGGRVQIRTSDSDAVALALLQDLGGTDLEIASGSLDQAFMALTSGEGSGENASGAGSGETSGAGSGETSGAGSGETSGDGGSGANEPSDRAGHSTKARSGTAQATEPASATEGDVR